MTLRVATDADAEAVASLYIASRKQDVAFAPLTHSEGEVHMWISQSLIPSGHVWVATQAEVIVAMMATSVRDRSGWIDQLYVAPGHTRRGYGSALVDLAKKILPKPILLFSFLENHGARRFYERHGFVPERSSDGATNEERRPDILFRFTTTPEGHPRAGPNPCNT
ncbi:MAG: GNAT family N-acetyltransferase [Cephaloticoccus sp.]|nr:GNAT family N-acetyltransferase [Cephaloticoccus sp.]